MQWDTPYMPASLSSHLPRSDLPPFHTRQLFLSQQGTGKLRTILLKPFQSQFDLVLLQSRCREHLQLKASVGLPASRKKPWLSSSNTCFREDNYHFFLNDTTAPPERQRSREQKETLAGPSLLEARWGSRVTAPVSCCQDCLCIFH